MSILVGPTLKKRTRSLTTKTIVVGNETEKGKRFGNTRRSETRVVADVRDTLIAGIIGAGAVTIVECVQRRLLLRCKLDG